MNLSRNLAESRSRPIFIVGYMHSGTTLLYDILRQNKTVYGGRGETKYFTLLPMIRELYPDLNDEATFTSLVALIVDILENGQVMERVYKREIAAFDVNSVTLPPQDFAKIVDAVCETRSHGRLFDAVYTAMAARAGKQRWVEKTPQHILHIDEILADIPDALFVEMIRDPRDVLASRKTRRELVWTDRFDAGIRQRQNLLLAFDPIIDTLSWKKHWQIGVNAKKRMADHYHRIRYEDLVTAPEDTIAELCAFAGMDYQEAMLDVQSRNTAEREVAAKGFSQSSIGRWQKVLAPADVLAIQKLAQNQMVSLGYVVEKTPMSALFAQPILLVRTGLGLVHRLYRRWRLGGRSYLTSLLRNYLGAFSSPRHK